MLTRRGDPGATGGRLVVALAVQAAVLWCYGVGVDIATTLVGRDMGGVERNPLMAPLVGRPALFGGAKIAAVGAGLVAGAVLWRRQRWLGVAWLSSCAAAQAWIGWHNLGQFGFR